MKNKIYVIFFVVSFVLLGISSCQERLPKVYQESDIQIIPKVESLNLNPGVFQFTVNTSFVVSGEGQKKAAELLIAKFKSATGWDLTMVAEAPSSNYVVFENDKSLGDEAYTLKVEDNYIMISASSTSGFLYGIQSLRQLLPYEIESSEKLAGIFWEVPNVEIIDGPRFKWRGLMLDLSRHFFDKDYIKETIDALALHKMNILHLHLVDDQGWRIEIKKYPKLTEVGAWRVDQEEIPWDKRTTNKSGEKGTYGGFLSQKDLKEIVAYASTNGVEVIPEIEMPAHVSSAIAAYPELGCFDEPKQIAVPSGALWPIEDIYCAGKETTFEFLENVLTEVMDIFPSKYIHVGGDEATKTHWETCPYCAKRIASENLDNVEELQSYFIKRMEKFINSKGKKLIGWDEILQGGLAPDATVMSWRSFEGGVKAARQGNDAIMTPVWFCYFDYYQGPPALEPKAAGPITTVSKVYEFEPIVEDLNAEETKHVLGSQANVWAEHIASEEHSQYMIFPRLTALSETLWSPKESRDWDHFSGRLKTMMKRYDMLDINYAKSAFIITSDVEADTKSKSVALSLHNEFSDSDIRYALNDAALDANSTKFEEPIVINETTGIKASLYKDNKPVGLVFTDSIAFHQGVSSEVDYGITYSKRYKGSGAYNLVNTLRGTENFRDGRWQAWLNDDALVTIDLGEEKNIDEVIVGSMVNQRNGIYYPTEFKVTVSQDGDNFKEVGKILKPYEISKEPELKDFRINFKEQKVRYVKIQASNIKKGANIKGGAWLFLDEILIN